MPPVLSKPHSSAGIHEVQRNTALFEAATDHKDEQPKTEKGGKGRKGLKEMKMPEKPEKKTLRTLWHGRRSSEK